MSAGYRNISAQQLQGRINLSPYFIRVRTLLDAQRTEYDIHHAPENVLQAIDECIENLQEARGILQKELNPVEALKGNDSGIVEKLKNVGTNEDTKSD